VPESPESRPAAEANVSLSQVVLAPVDALLKAQLHASRSFLNMLLQLGYPHQSPAPGDADPDPGATPTPPADGKPYTLTFVQEHVVNGVPRQQKLSLPALALVPINPLAVESASFSFDLAVREVGPHQQLKVSEADEAAQARPWYLVHEPVSILGALAPAGKAPDEKGGADSETAMHIELKVGATKIPAGLDRLLTTLTQTATLEDVPPSK